MTRRPGDVTAGSFETLVLGQLAADQRAAQATIAATTAAAARAAWDEVDRNRISQSWIRLVGRRVWHLVVAGQLAAAQRARRYLSRATALLGVPGPGLEVVPHRLAAVTSDGRDLATLLARPAITALTEIRDGRPPREALHTGAVQLDMIVRSEVADAGRVATGVELTATPTLGYVRMLSPPSCSRCVVLAGRFYRWNQGFQRHPRCDCIHIPVTEDLADDLRTDPRQYFDSLDEREQRRAFTVAGAQAIRDGADIARVVNARRGMTTAGRTETRVREDGQVVNVHTRRLATTRVAGREVLTTTEGTRRSRRVRLMPEQIYREAAGNRAEAIRLLRLHGYLR